MNKTINKFMSLVMAAVIVLPLIPTFALTVNAFSGSGNGTINDPYQITTATQLDEVRNDLSAHYIQMNDIDLTEHLAIGDGYTKWGDEGWKPIGDADDWYIDYDKYDNVYPNAFTGKYNGGGHRIIGLNINRTSTTEDLYVGLFGINSGIVKNISIDGGAVSGDNNTGGVIGTNWRGTVENCDNISGAVTGNNAVGGVVGWNLGAVESCSNFGKVIGNNTVGGVVGSNHSSMFANATIENCHNSGDITGAYIVGGVVGQDRGAVKNCYNAGSISGYRFIGGVCGINSYLKNCYNIGTVSGADSCVGGVVGDNSGTTESCYNTGAVEGKDFVGGVAGLNDAVIDTVRNCYNTGYVIGTDSVGGVVGASNGKVENCYNIGAINGTGSQGGAVGWLNSLGKAENCYYNTDIFDGLGICIGIDTAIGKTSVQMKHLEFTNLLNENKGTGAFWISDIPNINDGYPIFIWQLAGKEITIELTGYAGYDVPADMMVGFYNTQSQLLHVIKHAGVVIPDGEETLTIAMDKLPPETMFIKIFIWDGIQTMKPLINPIEIK